MDIRVGCLERGCHECCRETEMQLSEEDIWRLERLGYRRDEFSMVVDGIRVLKNVEGKCFFLRDGMCGVYAYRPLGCRLYPVVYDIDTGKATIHDFCPYGSSIDRKEIKKVERVLIKQIREIYGFLP